MSSKVMDILNRLYAGKRIRLQFINETDRETFRQSLYKQKRIQDAALDAVDMQDERAVLRCDLEDEKVHREPEVTLYLAVFYLEKKKEISFEIISVEENPVKEDHGGSKEKVSRGLGEDSLRTGEGSQNQNYLYPDDEKG